MSQETFQALSKLAFAICALVVAGLAFAPGVESVGFSYDKLNHLLAFAVLAWLADLGWPGRPRDLARWSWLVGYGLLIELVQGALTYRDFSWLDLATDALAILLYAGLRSVGLRLLRFTGARRLRGEDPARE